MISNTLLEKFDLTFAEYNELGFIEKLFLHLSEQLATIDAFAWIDLESGQLEIPLESYPIPFPCVLIDFPVAETQDEAYRNQQAICTIQIRIAIDLYEDLHMVEGNAAPDRAIAIKRLGLITKVHKCLQGYEEDFFTPLCRSSIQTEKRDDGIKVFSLFYGCAAKDDSAAVVVESKNTSTVFTKL
jgi:hypothetical protein